MSDAQERPRHEPREDESPAETRRRREERLPPSINCRPPATACTFQGGESGTSVLLSPGTVSKLLVLLICGLWSARVSPRLGLGPSGSLFQGDEESAAAPQALPGARGRCGASEAMSVVTQVSQSLPAPTRALLGRTCWARPHSRACVGMGNAASPSSWVLRSLSGASCYPPSQGLAQG